MTSSEAAPVSGWNHPGTSPPFQLIRTDRDSFAGKDSRQSPIRLTRNSTGHSAILEPREVVRFFVVQASLAWRV